jgi:hypothetical protein
MNVEVLGDDIAYGAENMLGFNMPHLKRRLTPKFRKRGDKFTAKNAAMLAISPWSLAFRGDDPYGGTIMGDEDMLGFDFSFLKKIGAGISKIIKSPAGKAIGTAALTTAAARMSPTQKAQLASAQAIAGIDPTAISAATPSAIPVPTSGRPGFDMQKNMPLLIGAGVGVVALMVILGTRRTRSSATA